MLDAGFSVPVNGEVTTLAASGTTLYLGGSFSTVGGASRHNIAAIDTSTGTVLPFKNTPSSTVEALAMGNGVVYVGGRFQKMGGVARPYLAALDPSSGVLVTSFDPKPSDKVYALGVTSSGVYVGGDFTSIGAVTRRYVARLEVSGAVQSWNAGLTGNSKVLDLRPDGADVYLAAGGYLPSGNSVYAVDAGTGAQRWQVQLDGNVEAVESAGGLVYGGGHFNYLKPCGTNGCVETDANKKAVAIDATSGAVDGWNPRFNSALGVFELNAAAGNLFALGDFTLVNGLSQAHIARFVL